MSTTAELLQAQKRKAQKALDNKANIKQSLSNKRGKDVGENQSTWASEIDAIEPLYDTMIIEENGEYNVTEYKNVNVNISTDETQIIIDIIENDIREVNIPQGATMIGQYKFYKNSSLNKVTIPNSVTFIGEQAFYGDSQITEVHLGNGLAKLGNMVFYLDSKFSTTMKVYINTLEDWFNIKWGSNYNVPFYNRGNGKLYVNNELLVNVEIPNSRTTLNDYCFSDCTSIESIKFNNNIRIIPTYFLSGNLMLKTIDFGNSVEEIKDYCFQNCKSLVKLTLPNSVKTLGMYVFQGCENLETLELGEGLNSIGNAAFFNTKKLTYLKIPNRVTNMGIALFNVSSGTRQIIIEMQNPTPCTIASSTFNTKYLNKIYVPKGTSGAYKSATNWSTFASYIFEKNSITLNIDSNYINNENYQYSTDKGVTWNVFTSDSISLYDVASLSFKNNGTGVLQIGTTASGTDIGTIASGNELTWYSTGDTTIYVTIQ